MSTRVFVRRPRAELPDLPDGELVIEPPPEMPRQAPPNVLMMILPVAMIAMVVGFIVIGGFNPATMMMGVMMLVTTVGMLTQSGGAGGDSKAQMTADRNDYLTYLQQVREELKEIRTEQREALTLRHPAPATFSSFVDSERMWERRPGDADFGQVRVGIGAQALTRPLRPPQTGPIDELEPVAALALQGLIKTHSSVPDAPIAMRLSRFSTIEFLGDPQGTRSLLRAMIASASVFHGPDTLVVAALVSPSRRSDWDWLKWLPHNHVQGVQDSLGRARAVASSTEQLEHLLHEELEGRPQLSPDADLEPGQKQILLIVDSEDQLPSSGLLGSGLAGVTVLDVSESTVQLDVASVTGLFVEEGRVAVVDNDDSLRWIGQADALSVVEADAIARQLAGFRAPERTSDGEEITPDLVASMDFADMLEIGDPAQIQADSVWRPRSDRSLLRAPIGAGPSGELVSLDIKESALSGMGPHGLVIGATGSGKSELLRTLVLALATTHSPDQLNFVLIDFKGGATFAGLGSLPHTSAVITNLEDDLTMVDRMYDALSGEMNRRQELLRDAGNVVNIREYAKARAALPPSDKLPVLPSLFIVCDEFSELLSQKPDFTELFVAIGRLGRSLGIHLLLASQRLEEGKLRGLDSHLSYRIGLKTFSPQESRTVLGVTDAYELPASPGSGYLKFDTGSMVRFKAAYVSGPYKPRAAGTVAGSHAEGTGSYVRPITFVSDVVDIEMADAPQIVEDAGEPEEVEVLEQESTTSSTQLSTLDVIVSRLAGQGSPVHAVWLPPLEISPSLDALYGRVEPGERGLAAADWAPGTLRFPVGMVDLPYEQRRDPLILNLSGAAGHTVVVGGPQSGKSTTMRTLISSLALTHTPREVQIYVIDLGGGSLGGTARLPHVGGVATRLRPDYLRRMLAEVWTVLLQREERFTELGIESMADYRRLRSEGKVGADDPFGDVFLVIDGWGAFREEFEELEPRITQLAARGLSYGIHLVIGASRWMEMRPAIKDAMLTRLELRLGDTGESEVSRAAAASVPASHPGRGLTNPGGKHMLIGLPRIDGVGDPDSLTEGFGQFVGAINDAWEGPRAPGVRMLPQRHPLAELPFEEGTHRLPFGLDEDTLSPVSIDADSEPFLVYFADGEMGKSNALRTIAEGVMRAYSPDEARILLVDYRRSLLDAVPQEYLAGYASGSGKAADFLRDVAVMLEGRLPPADVTAEQLKQRSWWSGKELFVLVDDYDLVTGMNDNPLVHLLPYLPQARDIGLHLVVARRASGAGNAMFDQVVGAMRNLAGLVFVGSGPRDEGELAPGARPSTQYGPGRGHLVDRRHGARLIQVASAERPD